MSLVLRRMIWPDGKPSMDPEDYRVYDGDRKVGWIFRTVSTGKPRWEWGMDYEMGKEKHGGLVDSLEACDGSVQGRMVETDVSAFKCTACDDCRWVCEEHHDRPWEGPRACSC